jgi:hypothetical protein
MSESDSTGAQPPKKQRDLWDKFQAVGGVATAVAVACIGFGGSMFLNNQQDASHKTQLYSQLMSEREKAENAVRKDMFDKILETFLKKENNSKVCAIDDIDIQLLKLDMLARNFHEALDLQPLFRDVLLNIVKRVNIDNYRMSNEELESLASNNTCRAALLGRFKKSLNRNDVGNRVQYDHIDVQKKRPLYEKFLSSLKETQKLRLFDIARRITNKQLESLTGVSQRFRFTIDIGKTCRNKKPNEAITDGDRCQEPGNKREANLTLDKQTKREFTLSSSRSYPKWNQVSLKIETNKTAKEIESDPDGGNKTTVEFWVSYFDFPLVDNTYLSSDERYAVILDDIDEKKAEVSLLYFPASFAGFKEKAYYQHRIMNTLMKDSLAN